MLLEEPSDLCQEVGTFKKVKSALCALICVSVSICLLVCVYIHKQALLLPVGQDVSVAFRTGTVQSVEQR